MSWGRDIRAETDEESQVKGEGLEQGTVFQIREQHEQIFCRRMNHGIMMGAKTPVCLRWERMGEAASGTHRCTRHHLDLRGQETRCDQEQQQHEAALGTAIRLRARDWKGETGQASWRRGHLG